MTYLIEVVDCNKMPVDETTPLQPKTTTMRADECMYLHLESAQDTSLDLVLSTEADKFADYWPAKYLMVEQKVPEDPSQQWFFNETSNAIHN